MVSLNGGVGGAKLTDGLAQILPSDGLTAIVNTGDDFDHFGLYISPDLDTVVYTLSGLANPKTGWGRADETWHFMEAVKALNGPTWFNLGDRDLALHAERTRRLEEGQPLSMITNEFCQALGAKTNVLPMTDDRVRTFVLLDDGEMEFQRYFVEHRAEPVVRGFRFEGASQARPAPGVVEALEKADLVVFCPSNPWVSLDPILAIPGIKHAMRAKPIVGVSPIISGKTVKGPAAAMFKHLGIQPSAAAVAEHYQHLLTYFVIDRLDEVLADQIKAMGIEVLVTNTLMLNRHDRRKLASEILNFVHKSTLKEGAV
ncbi:MAG: 2-phospho-L-lactate transferase [Anaerolineales bacterium]